MDRLYIENQLVKILCKEFQSVWLVKLDDLSLEVFTSDERKTAPHSVDTAKLMESYDAARLWYIDNFVVEHSREKMLEQTKLDYVLSMTEDGETFFVDYGRKSNGMFNYNTIIYSCIKNPDTNEVEYIVMGFRNVDIIKKAEIDEVTGLLRRRDFFAKAEKLLKDNPEVQYDLEISDIIDFKKINELYGVYEADRILKWVAQFLLTNMDENFLIGRFGGDQFVVMAPHEKIQEILRPDVIEEFVRQMRSADIPKCEIKFGIYENIPHNRSVVSSCDKAHIALNSIKNLYGRTIAFYNDSIEDHIEKQRKIENSMIDALREEQFKVYYQPKHTAKTGELIGAEALIRWIHPEYGFMSPGDFIPIFEQNGFIAQLDKYVWKRTCENLRRWQDKGINTVPISVNASRLSITSSNLAEDMVRPIMENHLSPSQLHVEVTETLMTDFTENLIDNLNKIRDMGCKVELDDFGSGYSSLNVLSTFPIDILKLDMTFLQEFGDHKRSVVLESCIDMAQKLGFKTVSEGVELEEQNNLLGELGVDIIQGYYYSRPLPEDDFEKYMIEYLNAK